MLNEKEEGWASWAGVMPSSSVLGQPEESQTAGLRMPRGMGAPVRQAEEGTSRGQRATG